jgi:SAM-dependent methyltransferase
MAKKISVARLKSRLKKYWLLPRRARRHLLVGPPHLWREKRQFQFDFLLRVGLKPEHHLLDFGCGTLRGGIPLIRYLASGHYVGFEVRAEALCEGLAELCEERLMDKAPILICADKLPPLQKQFDFIWMFSVLIHLTDPIAERAFAEVANHLAVDGTIYANAAIGDSVPDLTWREFPFVRRPLAFYQALANHHGLQCESLGPLAALGHDVPGANHYMLKFLKTDALIALR